MVEKYAKLEDGGTAQARRATVKRVGKATREFVTNGGLKLAKAEAVGQRKEKSKPNQADMAETAVREARGDFKGHGSESWSRSDLDSQSVASRLLQPRSRRAPGILRRRKDGTSPRACWCCRVACARGTASRCSAVRRSRRQAGLRRWTLGRVCGFCGVVPHSGQRLTQEQRSYVRSSRATTGRRWQSSAGRPATTRRRRGRREAQAHPRQK